MNIPVDLMIVLIKASEDCRQYLIEHYPHEYMVWDRFYKSNGEQCPLARAAIKRIFQLEYKSRGSDFTLALASANFGHKGYKEGGNGEPNSSV